MITVPKFFNTAGPIKRDIHYNIDPLKRIDLDEMVDLIQQQKYFILHAPRQTGKTSCLLALRDYLNEQGNHIAVYANVEAGQASRNNVEEVVKGEHIHHRGVMDQRTEGTGGYITASNLHGCFNGTAYAHTESRVCCDLKWHEQLPFANLLLDFYSMQIVKFLLVHAIFSNFFTIRKETSAFVLCGGCFGLSRLRACRLQGGVGLGDSAQQHPAGLCIDAHFPQVVHHDGISDVYMQRAEQA